jgi:F420-dependent oxidoreductase-like protein
MDVGIVVPQGWTGEYRGWDPAAAWDRSVAIATSAERLGFESIWLFDHLHAEDPPDDMTFEAFTSLSALAAVTRRVRLGHIVACAGYRNPALVAKMISTLDVISGGRAELGIGAGWYEGEHLAYGYRFQPARERLALLADTLAVVARMLAPGRATFEGRHAVVRGAINEPRGLQEPRIPLIVGGNGPTVTWRLAARHADELNLDGPTPDDIRKAMPVIRARCEEVGRPPDSLRVSVFLWWGNAPPAGPERVRWLREYREAGVSRVMASVFEAVTSDDALVRLADDVAAAGPSSFSRPGRLAPT